MWLSFFRRAVVAVVFPSRVLPPISLLIFRRSCFPPLLFSAVLCSFVPVFFPCASSSLSPLSGPHSPALARLLRSPPLPLPPLPLCSLLWFSLWSLPPSLSLRARAGRDAKASCLAPEAFSVRRNDAARAPRPARLGPRRAADAGRRRTRCGKQRATTMERVGPGSGAGLATQKRQSATQKRQSATARNRAPSQTARQTPRKKEGQPGKPARLPRPSPAAGYPAARAQREALGACRAT